MVLPGHLAAGFITTTALIAGIHPDLSSAQIQMLVVFGTLAGDLPDIDVAYHMLNKHTTEPKDLGDHRYYMTHAPLFWLIVGLTIFFLSDSVFMQTIGILTWLCSWSHLLCDSIEHGVMWLWPLSKKRFALRKVPETLPGACDSFWNCLFKTYFKTVTFYIEIIMCVVAIIVLLRGM
jgi:membrane-bound metal-dependent hydrolase YbcI (DUF457 family)